MNDYSGLRNGVKVYVRFRRSQKDFFQLRLTSIRTGIIHHRLSKNQPGNAGFSLLN